MNLHAVDATALATPVIDLEVEDDYDEDEDEDDGIHCPICGSHRWSQRVYGRYDEYHLINLIDGHEDWDMGDQIADNTDRWECENGHAATDNITEILERF